MTALALTTSTPLNVTLIASSSPVWMLAIGALFFKERPTRQAMAGAALSLLGVAIVLARGDMAQLARVRFVPGDLLMLLAIASWALYSWLLARPPASIGQERPPEWDWAAFLLVQTLFGVAAVGPAIAAFFANLTPVFAALLSAALLGEAPKAYHAVAFALTVAGIAVSSRRRRPPVR